jgi:hypothetical protein
MSDALLRMQAGPAAEIDGGDGALTFHLASEARTHRVELEASEDLAYERDAALLLGLLPAMRLGLPIRVPGDVSPRLPEGLGRAQLVFRHWDRELHEVPIEAEPRPMPQSRGARVGAFFSGGVDSFYTALKYRDQITDLIYIRGFDLGLSEHPELHARVEATAREVAAELGKNLIEVKTNVRDFANQYVGWSYYNGMCLAAIALLFQDRFRAVHLPASMCLSELYDEMTPNPLIDPMLGTECTQFVSSGVETERNDKIAYLADSELAMRNLRVCWQNPGGAYNCGACGKCLRTMISLHLAGALERCATLPHRLDPAEVRRMSVVGSAADVFTRETLRALEARGDERRLTRAVRTAVRRRKPEPRPIHPELF